MERIFKDILAENRAKCGIKEASELSKIVGKSQNYIGNLESGRTHPPPMPVCEKIADALKLIGAERDEFMRAAARGRRHCDTWYSDILQADLEKHAHRCVRESVEPYRLAPDDVIVLDTFDREPFPGETVLVEFIKTDRPKTLMEFIYRVGDMVILRDVNNPQSAGNEYPIDAVALGPITGGFSIRKRSREKK